MGKEQPKRIGTTKKPITKIDRISPDQFEALCKIQCTEEEICSVLGVNTDTLVKWVKRQYGLKGFKEAFHRFSAEGRVAIRRIQFRLAEHNPTMAIWLGKQYLGQKDDSPEPEDDVIEVISDVKD